MVIKESQLRNVIKQVVRESYDQDPNDVEACFKKLINDAISIQETIQGLAWVNDPFVKQRSENLSDIYDMASRMVYRMENMLKAYKDSKNTSPSWE